MERRAGYIFTTGACNTIQLAQHMQWTIRDIQPNVQFFFSSESPSEIIDSSDWCEGESGIYMIGPR